MTRHLPAVHIPTPCAEGWDAMSPTSGGRHCAACQKTVVDFSQKTDAEILAVLTKAVGGETCGRFGADQLNRPLLPALRQHWQAWAAIVLAAWGLRASPAEAAGAWAPAPPSTLHPAKKANPTHPADQSLRGLVGDAATHQPLASVAVFLKRENRMTMTDTEGRFSLLLPAQRAHSRHTLAIHRAGYQSKTVQLLVAETMPLVRIELRDDVTEAIVVAPFQPVQRQLVSGAVSNVMAAEITEPVPSPTGVRAGSFFRWLTKHFRYGHKLTE
ncbi:MAG: hypothetical protein EOO62_17635 [Hymenobacter sp.]|nr:MAG: hypothetical protein EOO62_17635 [Hymenobacter sp.]